MCQNCFSTGYLLHDGDWAIGFIICPNCRFETGQVDCDSGEAGGEFIKNIHEKPNPYKCRYCNSMHLLPPGFYNRPIEFVITTYKEPRNYVPKKEKNYDFDIIMPDTFKLLSTIPIVGSFLLMILSEYFPSQYEDLIIKIVFYVGGFGLIAGYIGVLNAIVKKLIKKLFHRPNL